MLHLIFGAFAALNLYCIGYGISINEPVWPNALALGVILICWVSILVKPRY